MQTIVCRRHTTVNYETKWSFNLQPKTIICEAQAIKAEFVFRILLRIGEKQTAVQAKKSVR